MPEEGGINWTRLGILVSLCVVLFAAVIARSCGSCGRDPSTERARAGALWMQERARDVEDAEFDTGAESGLRLGDEWKVRADLVDSEVVEDSVQVEEDHREVDTAFEEEILDVPDEEPESYVESEVDYPPPPEEEPYEQLEEPDVEAWFDRFGGVDGLDPDSFERALFVEARDAVREGEFEVAIELLEEVLETEPRYGPAHALLGTCNAHLKRTREAEFHYQRFVELSPEHPQAEAVIGILEEYDRSQQSPSD